MLVCSLKHGEAVLRRLFSRAWVAMDSETVPKAAWANDKDATLIHGRHKIKMWSICHRNESYSFATNIQKPSWPTHLQWAELINKVWEDLVERKKKPAPEIVMHNANYDLRVFRDAGVRVKVFKKFWDTMISSWLANGNEDKSLKSRAPFYGRYLRDTATIDFSDLATLAAYAEDDVIVTDEIFQMHVFGKVVRPRMITYLNDKLELVNVRNTVAELNLVLPTEQLTDFDRLFLRMQEFQTLKATVRCEYNGVPFARQKLLEVRAKMMTDMEACKKRIFRHAGRAINLNAPAQKCAVLTELGVKLQKKTAKGGFSADFEALLSVKDQHPIVPDMMEYAKIAKLEGTYIGPDGFEYYLSPKTGRIHPNLNTVGAVTGRFSSSNPNCFHPSTEYLTQRGWVSVADIRRSDKVAQWEPNGGKVTFVTPTNYYALDYSGDMIRAESRNISYFTTPEHRVVVHTAAGRLKVVEAQTLPEEHKYFHAGYYSGGKLGLSSAEITLLAALQADGSLSKVRYDFGFKKQRKFIRLTKALEDLKIPFNRINQKSRYRLTIHATEPTVVKLLKFLTDKCFNYSVFDLTQFTLQGLCDEIHFWDGDYTRRRSYGSSHRINIDVLQAVHSMIGRRTNVYEKKTPAGVPFYVLNTVPVHYCWTTNTKTSRTAYTGKVYCISVPSSYILSRHAGRVSVIGQCQNVPARNDRYKMRDCFEAPRGRSLVCLDFSQIELRVMAMLSQDPLMCKVLNDPKGDIHTTTATQLEVPRDPVAKQCNFLLIFGGGAYALSHRLNLEGHKTNEEECQLIVDGFNNTYSGVPQFRENAFAFHRKNGYIPLLTGRKRVIENIGSSNRYLRHKAETQLANNVVQGTAQDLMKCVIVRCDPDCLNIDRVVPSRITMGREHSLLLKDYAVKVDKYRKLFIKSKNKWCLQVHDEVLFECDTAAAPEVGAAIADIMTWRPVWEPVYEWCVKIKGDGGIGQTWASAKKPKEERFKIESPW